MNSAVFKFEGGKPLKEFETAARIIGKSHTTLTGAIISVKDKLRKTFEAPLEKDYLTILDFDWDIASFYPQPISISYPDTTGKVHKYTPDVLVYFRKERVSSKWRPPLLVEIKTKKDLAAKGSEYATKFKAAEDYAASRGWEFRVLTEDDIHTPYLTNARFLRQYRDSTPPEPDLHVLMNTITRVKYSTPNDLVSNAADARANDPEYLIRISPADEEARAGLIFALWNLVSTGFIAADLRQKLTMTCPIWFYGVTPPEGSVRT